MQGNWEINDAGLAKYFGEILNFKLEYFSVSRNVSGGRLIYPQLKNGNKPKDPKNSSKEERAPRRGVSTVNARRSLGSYEGQLRLRTAWVWREERKVRSAALPKR